MCPRLAFFPNISDSIKARKICYFKPPNPICFPCGSAGKESTCNARNLGSIPGLRRSPGEEKGHTFQYSGLENSMDCIVHGVAKSRTQLSDFHYSQSYLTYLTFHYSKSYLTLLFWVVLSPSIICMLESQPLALRIWSYMEKVSLWMLLVKMRLYTGVTRIRCNQKVAESVKNLPTVQETPVWSLGWEDPLETEMATHSSILA